MEEFGYRNLIVWQKAKKLVGLVYAEVKKLPAEERYAMGGAKTGMSNLR